MRRASKGFIVEALARKDVEGVTIGTYTHDYPAGLSPSPEELVQVRSSNLDGVLHAFSLHGLVF